VSSDFWRNDLGQFDFSAGYPRDLPLAPFGQSGRRSNRTGMLNSRAQCPEVDLRREIVRIDEERRLRIGRCDLDAPTALRPEESKADGKALVGFDFGRSHCGSSEQSVYIWAVGSLRAAKEKMPPAAGFRCHRLLRFADEAHDEAMVLKVLANAGQVAHDGDAATAKIRGIADTRKHEQAGRLDHSPSHHPVPFARDRATLGAVPQPNARATMSLERESLDAGTGHERQVLSFKRRE